MRLATLSKLSSLTISSLLLTACLGSADQPVASTEVARQGVYSATFSQNGQWLMVGSIHHGGSLWSLWPAERHFDWSHSADGDTSIMASAFSADQRYVATADNRTIVLWQRQTGEAASFWNAPGDILDLALTGTGRYAVLAMQDYTATIFDIQNGGIYHRLQHDGSVYDVSIDGADKLVASGSDDLTARVWSLETGKELLRLQHGNQVRTVELSRDGRTLFSSAMREPGKFWDPLSGKQLASIAKPSGHYSSARFDYDGKLLLTGSSDGYVALWQVSDGSLLRQWQLNSDFSWNKMRVLVEDVAFASDGYYAVDTNGKLYQLK
ncbi:WD40 repeat domain-containing protein [Oceanobacter mangrovi]|uniref:WD40 repeat domain-containing protein n=1 Tax=Oceanobacter mangrovi TaxID=2862510 RepID=UPI001C8D7908|nr:hypothetical protein [Oceanobacter mangrovi]